MACRREVPKCPYVSSSRQLRRESIVSDAKYDISGSHLDFLMMKTKTDFWFKITYLAVRRVDFTSNSSCTYRQSCDLHVTISFTGTNFNFGGFIVFCVLFRVFCYNITSVRI